MTDSLNTTIEYLSLANILLAIALVVLVVYVMAALRVLNRRPPVSQWKGYSEEEEEPSPVVVSKKPVVARKKEPEYDDVDLIKKEPETIAFDDIELPATPKEPVSKEPIVAFDDLVLTEEEPSRLNKEESLFDD